MSKIKVSLSAAAIAILLAGGTYAETLNNVIVGGKLEFTNEEAYKEARGEIITKCKPNNCKKEDMAIFLDFMKYEGKTSTIYKDERKKLLSACINSCDINNQQPVREMLAIGNPYFFEGLQEATIPDLIQIIINDNS